MSNDAPIQKPVDQNTRPNALSNEGIDAYRPPVDSQENTNQRGTEPGTDGQQSTRPIDPNEVPAQPTVPPEQRSGIQKEAGDVWVP